MPAKKLYKIFPALCILFIGITMGVLLRPYFRSVRAERRIVRLPSHEFQFIDPLLGFDTSAKSTNPIFQDIEKQSFNYIESNKKNNKISSASIYVRDLDIGRWTGVNEDEKYAPASLLKVFVMMIYFKLGETQPNIFYEKLFYEGKEDRNTKMYYKPETSLQGQKRYTIEHLIMRMITQSGNNSSDLLIHNVGDIAILHLLKDLDLAVPNGEVDFMSARSYSFVFRVLYNATYLSEEMSEKALALLSRTEFLKGIQAGVPQDTLVSHKFGERWSLKDPQGPKELHDCGIIYYPDHPFFLCIMTKGYDFPELEEIIKNLTSMIYGQMDTYYRSMTES